ncbi:hypothetical protein [Nonomuraea ferruginea]|uniref:DUF4157 domain-containing protein n=1 Tax=Nonomuraea ferruginea TaxID=46174 RepID=A0ABT4T2H3_9ACTN|nr:hypothetical protein [Nonomuraea ferruginea]MDA0643696.1 hypothetical protein [Nonomuraea ferruginea]
MSGIVGRRAVVAGLVLAVAAAGGAAPESWSAGVPDELAGVRELWRGELGVARGERALVAGQRADPGLLADLARRADAAGRRVSGVLGRPVRPLVLVPASGEQAARLAGVADVRGLAAVADGRRVIVVPEGFARLNPTGRDVVLAHELTHVAAGTDGLPGWLYEGFADYVAYRDAGLAVTVAAAELAAEVRAGRLPDELPGAGDFGSRGDALARAYQEAWLACRFLVESAGEGTLVRLYRDAQSVGTDRALAARGLTLGGLTRGWRAYVRDQLG